MTRSISAGSPRARVGFAVLATMTFAVALSAGAVVDNEEVGSKPLPDFDSRPRIDPSADQIAAAAALGATVEWNQFGTPSSIVKYGGYLATNVQGADAVAAARTWLDANRQLFKLDPAAALTVATAAPLAGTTTVYAVTFRQQFDGLSSADAVATVGLVQAGKGWNVTYVSSSLTGAGSLTGSTDLTATEAWTQAAAGVGTDVSAADVTVQGTSQGWTELEVKGKGKQYVRKAAFPTPGRGGRQAYEAQVLDQKGNGEIAAYRVVVDAQTGELLLRANLVDNAVDDPMWLADSAWPQQTPINEFPWNYPDADVRDLWCWTRDPGCQLAVANQASPQPWDVDNGTGVPTFTTMGNNVRDAENWLSANNPTTPLGFQPASPSRDYTFPFTNVWFETRCSQANFVPGVGNDIAAAVVNLFAMHNRMHDWSYNLGFDEFRWNAQNHNYVAPPPFLGNDALFGDAQAGAVTGGFPTFAGRDNANMATRPDGQHSVTNMYLWQPLPGSFYAPCVDGDFDMGVIGHEFGHMIENRMIGKGNRRLGTHAGAMGEAFGDFDAIEYLNEYNFVPYGGAKSPFVEGSYVTGNPITGIRNYDMSWPMGGQFPQPGKNPAVNPLNLGAYGYDVPGPEVHSDGEIWIAVNYTIRDLFLQRYPPKGEKINRQCADGQLPASACPGNRRWIQLVYDAMLLMPTQPTLISARNAYLAADVARFGGANQDLLWLAFAARGLGQLATTTSSQDTDPIPDFSSPLHDNATVVFNAVAKDEDGVPVNATIYAGDYQARATPIADTNPATAGPNLDNVAQFVPIGAYTQGPNYGAYNFVANARGYGHVRFRVHGLKPGETRAVTILFPTNYASSAKGAVATGDGTNQQNLIDDNEGTNWTSSGAPVEGRQVLVKLGGTGAVTFSNVNVSALLGPGQNRFTALRQFELYACTAGSDAANPTCDSSNDAGFRRILRSEKDAFPSVNPRPQAPDLLLRTWNVPTTTATHVLFRVLQNQCTGQESFHGDQDNDPANNSDCRIGDPPVLPPRNLDVRASELQVHSSNPDAIGAIVEK